MWILFFPPWVLTLLHWLLCWVTSHLIGNVPLFSSDSCTQVLVTIQHYSCIWMQVLPYRHSLKLA